MRNRITSINFVTLSFFRHVMALVLFVGPWTSVDGGRTHLNVTFWTIAVNYYLLKKQSVNVKVSVSSVCQCHPTVKTAKLGKLSMNE